MSKSQHTQSIRKNFVHKSNIWPCSILETKCSYIMLKTYDSTISLYNLAQLRKKKTSIQLNFLELNPPPFTTYFGNSTHTTFTPLEMKKTPPPLKILRFFFSNNLSAFGWKLQNTMLLHLSVICLPNKDL